MFACAEFSSRKRTCHVCRSEILKMNAHLRISVWRDNYNVCQSCLEHFVEEIDRKNKALSLERAAYEDKKTP